MTEFGNGALLESERPAETDTSITGAHPLSPPRISRGALLALLAVPHTDHLLEHQSVVAHQDVENILATIVDYNRHLVVRQSEIFSPTRENIYKAIVSRRPSLDDEDMLFDDI